MAWNIAGPPCTDRCFRCHRQRQFRLWSGSQVELDPGDESQPITDSDIAPLGVPAGLTHEEPLLAEAVGVSLELGVEGRPGHGGSLRIVSGEGKAPSSTYIIPYGTTESREIGTFSTTDNLLWMCLPPP